MKKKFDPIFVIISGGSGSGKTTVANLVKKNLPKWCTSEVVSLDNFYIPRNKIKTNNYDSPEAIDWFLVRSAIVSLIKDQKTTKIPIYDFTKQMYTGTKLIKPVDVLIFEGILALYDENIKDMANIKIYIDVPDDERLIRRLKRDLKSRGSDVDKTISAWRENVIRMHHKYVEPTKYISDLIIPWGGDKENLIPIKAISGALEYAIYSGKNKK